MLHDPRWDKTPSLAGFALFVASRDPKESYNWTNCIECAVGQYLASINMSLTMSEWKGDLEIANKLAHGVASKGDWVTGNHAAWTFGALADRVLGYQCGERAFVREREFA